VCPGVSNALTVNFTGVVDDHQIPPSFLTPLTTTRIVVSIWSSVVIRPTLNRRVPLAQSRRGDPHRFEHVGNLDRVCVTGSACRDSYLTADLLQNKDLKFSYLKKLRMGWWGSAAGIWLVTLPGSAPWSE